jgi:hypothetical protein
VRADDGVYDVSVGPPLDVTKDSKLDYAAVIRSYVEMLEPYEAFQAVLVEGPET